MKAAAGLTLVALVAAFGCEAPRSSGTVLKPDQFEDVPVPRGATYRAEKERSYSYRSDTFRCGRFVYDYSGSAAEAVTFFKDAMVRAPYNWRQVDEQSTAEGSATLVFTKNSERCTVAVDHIPTAHRDDVPTVFIRIRLNYEYH